MSKTFASMILASVLGTFASASARAEKWEGQTRLERQAERQQDVQGEAFVPSKRMEARSESISETQARIDEAQANGQRGREIWEKSKLQYQLNQQSQAIRYQKLRQSRPHSHKE